MSGRNTIEGDVELSPDVIKGEEMKTKLLKTLGSPTRRKIFNLDQEILIDSGALILLKDVTLPTPTPKISAKLLPALKNQSKISKKTHDNNKQKGKQNNEDRSIISETTSNIGITDRDEENKLKKSSVLIAKSKKIHPEEANKDINVFETKDKDQKEENKHTYILKILDNKYFIILMVFFVIWALFSDDVRHVACDTTVDNEIDAVLFVAMCLFTIELILMSIAKREYRWSFYFYLDCLSTLSVLFDITWIADLLFDETSSNGSKLISVGKASRIAARSGRVVRILQLIKIVKMLKFSKKKSLKKNDNANKITPSQNQLIHMGTINLTDTNKNDLSNIQRVGSNYSGDFIPSGKMSRDSNIKRGPSIKIMPIDILNRESLLQKNSTTRRRRMQLLEEKLAEEEEENEHKESRVGKKLSELTTIRVVIIVLLLLIGIPLCAISYYVENDHSSVYMIKEIANVYENYSSDNYLQTMTSQNFIYNQQKQGYPVVYMNLNGNEYSNGVSPDLLRDDEKDIVTAQGSNSNGTYSAIIDLRQDVKLEAGLSIGRTLFVCVVLVLGAFRFSADTKELALLPIERMIEKVNKIAKNPLCCKDEHLVRDFSEDDGRNEIIQIENAIVKIGTLLALGFGDAGTEIIGANIVKGGDVDPMIPGKRKSAIFGFCDIRNFTDATEVLQEDVMVFVNSIADIVHRYADKYCGAANKNIGDAFLITWKFPDSELIMNENGICELDKSFIVQNLVDLSLISFLKIYARINKDELLLKYRKDPRLISRLTNYKVKMGFGLHIGWAIEGAIGSEFKIDASYLSPNVNMASRLEAATKQYGVPLLFSGNFAEKLSDETRAKCRLIDIVTVKGSKKPIELWTIDARPDDLQIAKPRPSTKLARKQIQKEKKMLIKDMFIVSCERASTLFDVDKDLLNMIDPPNNTFYTLFKEAFDSYISGDWSLSKRKFEECLNIDPNDGPTKTLYEFLKENDFIVPEEWQGYRELTEK